MAHSPHVHLQSLPGPTTLGGPTSSCQTYTTVQIQRKFEIIMVFYQRVSYPTVHRDSFQQNITGIWKYYLMGEGGGGEWEMEHFFNNELKMRTLNRNTRKYKFKLAHFL